MNLKTVKVLSGCALGVQLTALIITVLMCIYQEPVKKIFTVEEEIQGVKSFPVAYIVTYSLSLLLYLVLLAFAYRAEGKEKVLRTVGIVLFVITCVFHMGGNLLAQIESILIASKGMEQMASLSVLNSAISLATELLIFVAFGLFAMAVGVGLGLRETSKQE